MQATVLTKTNELYRLTVGYRIFLKVDVVAITWFSSLYLLHVLQGFPIIFHGVEGRDEREGHSPSFFNLQEVQIVVEYVEELREKRGGRKIKQSDIGIISPYRRQVCGLG